METIAPGRFISALHNALARVEPGLSSRIFWTLAIAAVAPIALVGCGDDYRDANETDRLNAYFYYPRDSDRPNYEVYLGEVTGISACRRAASSFAGSKNMTSRSGWSYICCRIAHGSSCYDKSK